MLQPVYTLGLPYNPAGLGHVRLECVEVTPAHPMSLALIDYVRRQSLSAGLLSHRTINPRDLALLLPHLFIAEPVEGAGDFDLPELP